MAIVEVTSEIAKTTNIEKAPENHKRKVIKIFICLIIFIVCLWFIFIYSLDLRKTSDRSWSGYHLTPYLIELIETKTKVLENPEDIIDVCCDVTTDYLSFARTNDITNKKANCVGYARLTSALLNHAFRKKNMVYKAKSVVGTVHSFGVNLNNVAQYIFPSSWRPFFKDHDFVEISTGRGRIYVDTSLRDLTGRKFVMHERK